MLPLGAFLTVFAPLLSSLLRRPLRCFLARLAFCDAFCAFACFTCPLAPAAAGLACQRARVPACRPEFCAAGGTVPAVAGPALGIYAFGLTGRSGAPRPAVLSPLRLFSLWAGVLNFPLFALRPSFALLSRSRPQLFAAGCSSCLSFAPCRSLLPLLVSGPLPIAIADFLCGVCRPIWLSSGPSSTACSALFLCLFEYISSVLWVWFSLVSPSSSLPARSRAG